MFVSSCRARRRRRDDTAQAQNAGRGAPPGGTSSPPERDSFAGGRNVDEASPRGRGSSSGARGAAPTLAKPDVLYDENQIARRMDELGRENGQALPASEPRGGGPLNIRPDSIAGLAPGVPPARPSPLARA